MHASSSPSAYHPRVSGTWWTKNSHYLLYMLRELSSLFAALWVVLFLFQLPLMAGGPDAHKAWLDTIGSPGWIIFSLICLAFVLYHAYTAFAATGVLLYLRMGPKPVNGASLNGLMFVAWTWVTIVVALILVTPQIGG